MKLVLSRAGTLGALAVALFGLATAHGAETTLRYQFKPGDKLQYVMDQKMAMTMNVGGNDMKMDMTQTVDLSWNVVSVESGKAKMKQRFDRIRFSMNGPMGKTEYDSKDGKAPDDAFGQMIVPVFQALAGAELTLTMDDRGRVSDVKVPEKVTEAIKNMPGGGAGMANMFSEENLKKMTGAGGLILPEGPIAKGKSWETTNEMKMPFGTMKVTNQATDEGTEQRDGRPVEKIALKPRMTLQGTAAEGAPTVKLKEQEAKGNAYFDNAAGRLTETMLDQTMKMDVNAAGQDVTQTIVQKITMKLQGK